jgi:cytoskeletal protein CcmA (bactofilin family)
LGAWALSGLLLGALLWLLQPAPAADAQGGITNFDTVVLSGDLIVGDDGTFGGDLSVTGIIAASSIITEGDLTLPGSIVVSDTLTVDGASTLTGDVSAGGALTVADNALITGTTALVGAVDTSADLTVGDDLVVTDDASANDLTVADFFNVTAQGVVTATMNGWITPTGSLQPLTAAGAVSIDGGTNIAHLTDYLILVNIGAQTITISETTGLISAGNIALGAGDSATLIWADGGWIQIGLSNN